MSVTEQLQNGVRMLDVRVEPTMRIAHLIKSDVTLVCCLFYGLSGQEGRHRGLSWQFILTHRSISTVEKENLLK